MSPFHPHPIVPTGTRPGGPGFVCGPSPNAGFRAVMPDVEVYPPAPNGEALRRLRIDERPPLSIRAAAKIVGLTGREISDLEQGRAGLEENEWARLFEAIRAGRRAL